MATKTVSLKESTYEKLKNLKRDKESFSDVIDRIASGVKLSDFHGKLSSETADELESIVKKNRDEHRSLRDRRVEEVADRLDN